MIVLSNKEKNKTARVCVVCMMMNAILSENKKDRIRYKIEVAYT
jgi:hypothetical protein